MSAIDKRIEQVEGMATELGLVDQTFMALIKRVNRALRSEFKDFDSGIGIGVADYHIRYGGVEYKIQVTPNRTLDQKEPS